MLSRETIRRRAKTGVGIRYCHLGTSPQCEPRENPLDVRLREGAPEISRYPTSLIKVGPVYEWGAWHVMNVDTAELAALFPITLHEI